jgi:hypothetical protein
MAHRKQSTEKDIIVVRFASNTYIAMLDGEKTSCTAGPEMAAQRLASKIFGQEMLLKPLKDTRQYYWRYAVKTNTAITDPAKHATHEQKSAAFEWLRNIAASNPGQQDSEHAAILMHELIRLNANPFVEKKPR